MSRDKDEGMAMTYNSIPLSQNCFLLCCLKIKLKQTVYVCCDISRNSIPI